MMTRGRNFLAVIVWLSPVVLILGQIIFMVWPYLFVNRHLPNYVINNQIMDASFYAALVVGTVGGIAMFFLDKRPRWIAVAVATVLIAVASVYLSAGFGIAMMH
jgi:hypothetical protein